MASTTKKAAQKPAQKSAANAGATALAGRHAIPDGEIVVLGCNGLPSFAALQQRMRTRVPSASQVSTSSVRFYLFDLLHLDGTDLMPLPYAERRPATTRPHRGHGRHAAVLDR